MSETTILQSNTWPFADWHDDIPSRLFIDAHVVGALACSLTAVTVIDGNVWVSLNITGLDNDVFEVSSNTVKYAPQEKIKFFNAVGKCCGWLLTGDRIPERVVVQGVSYPLAMDVCLPIDSSYMNVNTAGVTGNWTIVGRDGIDVETEYDDSQDKTIVHISTDETFWEMEDPNAVEKQENEGIWTINELPGENIGLDIENGLVFVESVDTANRPNRLLFVPPLVFFSDEPDGSSKTHYVFNPNWNNGEWNNHWTGTDGTAAYDETTGLFTVVVGGVTRSIKINDTVVNTIGGQNRLERLTIAWKGLSENDPFRKIITTSGNKRTNTGDMKWLAVSRYGETRNVVNGKPVTYPLDPILNGETP